MIKAAILSFRVLGILWILARCDAFAVFEDTLVNQRLLRLVRRLAARDCTGRPGGRRPETSGMGAKGRRC